MPELKLQLLHHKKEPANLKTKNTNYPNQQSRVEHNSFIIAPRANIYLHQTSILAKISGCAMVISIFLNNLFGRVIVRD